MGGDPAEIEAGRDVLEEAGHRQGPLQGAARVPARLRGLPRVVFLIPAGARHERRAVEGVVGLLVERAQRKRRGAEGDLPSAREPVEPLVVVRERRPLAHVLVRDASLHEEAQAGRRGPVELRHQVEDLRVARDVHLAPVFRRRPVVTVGLLVVREDTEAPALAEAVRHRGAEPRRVERAVGRAAVDLTGLERPGRDADDSAHRVVSEKARGGPPSGLDAFDRLERRLVPVDVSGDAVVQRDAVEENEGPVPAEAPHRDAVRRRLDEVAVSEREVQADDRPEGVVESSGRRPLEDFLGDDRHADRDVRKRLLGPRGAHHHLLAPSDRGRRRRRFRIGQARFGGGGDRGRSLRGRLCSNGSCRNAEREAGQEKDDSREEPGNRVQNDIVPPTRAQDDSHRKPGL